MIARTYSKLIELYPDRDQVLTKEILLDYFTEAQIEASTYFNKAKTKKSIRLMNNNEAIAYVPGLYSYNKQYIEHFQSTYSNVTALVTESRLHTNRRVDLVIFDKGVSGGLGTDSRINPPLPRV